MCVYVDVAMTTTTVKFQSMVWYLRHKTAQQEASRLPSLKLRLGEKNKSQVMPPLLPKTIMV